MGFSMKAKVLSIFLTLFVLSVPVMAGEYQILKTYRGIIQVEYWTLSKGKKVPNRHLNTGPIIIKSDKDHQKFISRIPKNGVSRRNPPPKNNDPLFKTRFDFNKHMLIVLINPSINSRAIVSARTLNLRSGKRLEISYSWKISIGSQPTHLGAYHAMVMNRFTGRIAIHAMPEAPLGKR